MQTDIRITAGNTAVRTTIIGWRRECIEKCLNMWVSAMPLDYQFRVINPDFYDTDLQYVNKALSTYDEYIAG